MLRRFMQWYSVFNILSLDIVTGSVICSLFFGKLLGVKILPYGLLGLGLTVWIIYTADHLLDAKAIKHEAASPRHRFHQKHFKSLSVFMLILAFVDFCVILFARKPVLLWGAFLAFFVAIYLLVQRYLKMVKELFIAFLYTCGVLLPAISVTSITLDTPYILLIVQFFLIALTNLLLFSWFDKERDRADLLHSFVTMSGKTLTAVSIYGISIINLALTVILLKYGFEFKTVAILATMHLMLLVIFIFHQHMNHNYTYRLLGDAVFLLPVFYFL
jgi:4-hydroxybenzoate polyprenyltransferase